MDIGVLTDMEKSMWPDSKLVENLNETAKRSLPMKFVTERNMPMK